MNLKYIFILIVIILNFMACSDKSDQNIESNILKSPSLEELPLIKAIKLDLNSKDNSLMVSDLSIVSNHAIGDELFIMYLFKSENKLYEGLCRVKKVDYHNIYNDFTKVDNNTPFTVHQLSEENDNRKYLLISGICFNEYIKSIQIEFNDSSKVGIELVKSTYSYITNKKISIKNIKALNKDGDVIFIYPPYPPNKK